MNRKALWMASLLLPVIALAQSPDTRPAIPDGGARIRLVSLFIPNLPNAPFTATVNTEWVRTLGDGSRITLVNHRLIARDSAGRVFQERRRLVPPNSPQPSPLTETDITDPVLKLQYVCDATGKTCEVRPRAFWVTPATRPPVADDSSENLGVQTIAGVEVVGARQTVVIPPGAIGNDSPIKTTREYWFSPKLGFNLISQRDDPRAGTQRFEVSDLTLSEPDAKLFSLPPGSRVLRLSTAQPPDPNAGN